VVALVRVHRVCAVGRSEAVTDVALGIEAVWLRVARWIMVHSPGIEDNDSVLWDELTLVCEVLARNMRSAQPERVVTAFNLSLSQVRYILVVFPNQRNQPP
jgi:hypothetical protein